MSFYRDTITGKVDKNEGKNTPEKGYPLYRGNPILLRRGVSFYRDTISDKMDENEGKNPEKGYYY